LNTVVVTGWEKRKALKLHTTSVELNCRSRKLELPNYENNVPSSYNWIWLVDSLASRRQQLFFSRCVQGNECL
jgi:hypothetical protein